MSYYRQLGYDSLQERRLPCPDEAHTRSSCCPKSVICWKPSPADIRHRIAMSFGPRSCCWRRRDCRTKPSPLAWIRPARSCGNGANATWKRAWRGWKNAPAGGGPGVFPPQVVCEVKALACQLPAEVGLPFSRFSREDLRAAVIGRGIVAQISGATIWNWLSEDAIRPWSHRSWIYPRDPNFAEKAGRVLDLYERQWEGRGLVACREGGWAGAGPLRAAVGGAGAAC